MSAKKKAPVSLIDLRKELLLQVDGVDEKDHTIAWEKLKNIGDATQALISKLAKYSLENNVPPAEALKLEFIGMHKGSAIPDFKLPELPNTLFNTDKFYRELNQDFSFIVAQVDKGNYQKIADKYNEPSVKNEIVNAVYNFSNAAGTTPLRIVKPAIVNGETRYRPLAKIKPMSFKIKGMLAVPEPKSSANISVSEVKAVGNFILKTGKNGRKTKKEVHVYTQKEAILSLRFDSIETDNRIYLLTGEILFTVTEDKKNHVEIENQLLDIYVFGKSMEEAQDNLFIQFDYLYRRLISFPDNQLSNHLLKAKKYLNLIVDNVKEK